MHYKNIPQKLSNNISFLTFPHESFIFSISLHNPSFATILPGRPSSLKLSQVSEQLGIVLKALLFVVDLAVVATRAPFHHSAGSNLSSQEN